MSYAHGAELQAALYGVLTGDARIAAEIGSAVYDTPPAGSTPATYVMLGAETVRDRSHGTGALTDHDVTISVVSDAGGFGTAKRVAGLVAEALHERPPALASGTLTRLRFLRATALREPTGDGRRIDLIFRARIDAGD